MKNIWNERIYNLIIVSIIFSAMNYGFYLIFGFEIAIIVILGMIQANIVINADITLK